MPLDRWRGKRHSNLGLANPAEVECKAICSNGSKSHPHRHIEKLGTPLPGLYLRS